MFYWWNVFPGSTIVKYSKAVKYPKAFKTSQMGVYYAPVSYTHLDVYKRQTVIILIVISTTNTNFFIIKQ